MKMRDLFQIIPFLCLIIGCSSTPSNTPTPITKPTIIDTELTLTDAEKIDLQIIHQLSWSAQKIYTYNDIIVLDEERHILSSDSLDLSKFKNDIKNDNNLYTIVENLHNLIFEFKEAEEERKALEEFRRDEKIINMIENANIFRGMNPEKFLKSQSTKISVGDPYTELAVIGAKLFINLSDSISNYILIRKKLELKLKKEKFELDKKKRERLKKSLEVFDKSVKNTVAKILPKDKGLRTTLEHINKLVEEVKKAKLDENPQGETDSREKITRLLKFLYESKSEFNYFPMYWYYRGVCEDKLGHTEEAIQSYKQYQKLDIALIKWNKISASVAMNIIRLLLNQKEDYKDEIYSQLNILDENTNMDEDFWNYQYFAGIVYLYNLGDIPNAKKELRKAEEKLSRVYYEEWKEFKKKLEEGKEIGIPAPTPDPKDLKNICKNTSIIPSGHALYLCRLALNNAKILETSGKIQEYSNLLNELQGIINKEMTSIFEGLNYFGSTKSSIFMEQYLKELASIRISVNYEAGIDELIVTLPLKCFLLKEVYPTLHLFTFNNNTHKYEPSKVKSLYSEEIVNRRRSDGFVEKKKEMVLKTRLYDRYEDRFLTPQQKVKIFYDVEVDEMKEANVEYLELRIPHGDNQHISVLFDIDDIFNENIIDPFMFARAVIYDGKLYRLFGNVIATDSDDTFDKCRGGGTWWDSPQRCNGWRFQSLKWPGGNLRIVDSDDRVRISFPKDNEEAMKIKDRLWDDICKQLKNENYWKDWLKDNPPVSISSDNKHIIIHQLFHKTR